MSDPCAPIFVEALDGARITACAHGGQLLGWVPAGSDRDRLWLSPTAQCGPGKSVRGGIPVVFPQFSDRGSLPKHGFVRDRDWEVLGGSAPGRFVARLRDDATTRAIWPFGFELTVDAAAVRRALTVALTVRATGDEALRFMAALHLYLAVGAPEATTVTGLGDLPAEDNAANRAPVRLPAGRVRAVERRDVAVHGVSGPVHVDDPAFGPLTVEADGFHDRVIWNPGSPSGLGDVPAGDENAFFCLEPAALTPVTLAPAARGRAGSRCAPDAPRTYDVSSTAGRARRRPRRAAPRVRLAGVTDEAVTEVDSGPRRVARQVLVSAPADEVFALVADPHRHPELDGSGTLRDTQVTGPDQLSKGAKFSVGMKQYGVPYTITSRVTQYEENRLVEWQHPMGHRWRWELDEVEPGATWVTETFDYRTAKVPKLLEVFGMPGKNATGISATLRALAARFA